MSAHGVRATRGQNRQLAVNTGPIVHWLQDLFAILLDRFSKAICRAICGDPRSSCHPALLLLNNASDGSYAIVRMGSTSKSRRDVMLGPVDKPAASSDRPGQLGRRDSRVATGKPPCTAYRRESKESKGAAADSKKNRNPAPGMRVVSFLRRGIQLTDLL